MISTHDEEISFPFKERGYACPSCKAVNFEQKATIRIKKFLFIELSREEIYSYILCSACHKKTTLKELIINKKATVVHDKQTGQKISTYTDTFISKGKIQEKTVLRYDNTHVLPNVADKHLLATTIINSMYYIALLDDSVNLRSNYYFNYILDSYAEVDLMALIDTLELTSMEEVRIQAVDRFAASKKAFLLNELNFILNHCLGLIKGQLFIKKEVEDFLFQLLDSMGIRQLERASYLQTLLNKLYL
jgi:hypothetical protein